MLRVKRIGNHKLDVPKPATKGAAGIDLRACLGVEREIGIVVMPGEMKIIGTGFAFEIPPHMVGKVVPRSGWAAKHQITVLNSPGIIDSDYRGEVHVILINHGKEPFFFQHGDRMGQLIVLPIFSQYVECVEVDELDETDRGEGKFGSTGAA